MKRVFKYTIDHKSDYFKLELPKNSEILTVQTQKDFICIWAVIDELLEKEIREFRIAGTGHPIYDEIKSYIGTYQLFGGDIVFHIFEIK